MCGVIQLKLLDVAYLYQAHQPTLTYLHSVGIDQAQCGVLPCSNTRDVFEGTM